MNSVSDYLIQLQKLTRQNFDILSAINESFFSKQTHLNVKVGDNNYAIPSFIYLENKINNLQANFDNLINAPATGEAFFNFDGNSRAIEMRSFTNTPNSIKLEPISTLSVQQNDIFKDFLTPIPYFRVNLSEIPDDIVSVNVKKVIPKNDALIEHFKSILNQNQSQSNITSVNYSYSELYKILSIYKEDEDYIEYDSVKSLPIRKNIGTGLYVIESIVSDNIDENLDEFITIKLRNNIDDERVINNLAYRLFDETIYKQINVGDCLITYDNSAKLEVVEIFKNTNTIRLKVLYGEYLNLLEEKTETDLSKINDMCKLRFFTQVDTDEYKYIDIPLEEDKYVFVSVAPLNSRLNIQASWGTGIILNTANLIVYDNNGNQLGFPQYYEKYVKNIGDILYEITSAFNSQISALTQTEYNNILQSPHLNPDNLQVIQINKHLNDSPTIQNIRALYSQKKRYNTELTEIQTNIDNINTKLSSISFDDTSGMRSVYTSQLSEYNTKKNELVTSITKVINEISIAANNSEIPIEAAKYHIRGFFDYKEYMKQINVNDQHVIGIEVQYRYKNIDQPQGTAHSINKFLYTDWNIMNSFINYKYPDLSTGVLKYTYPEYNGDKNEPSINQIDIPISQGETVDIKMRILYDYGYPFIKTVSNWSDVINVAFPKEYLKDIQIVDIISENNNDIETNRFNNIINERGIPSHIEDRIVDQDLTYFHRPENIASGFYTNERRIIPLKDKLSDMDNVIKTIQDEVLGSSAESLSISINNGDVSNTLYPFQTNNIGVESYNNFTGNNNGQTPDGTYIYDTNTKIVSTILNIIIANKSNHTCKLYSMFPGSRDVELSKLINTKYNKTDYLIDNQNGVWINYDKSQDGTIKNEFKLQTANQFVTFRINDPFNGETYYSKTGEVTNNTMPSDYKKYKIDSYGTLIYPKIREELALCMNNDTTNTYRLLSPGEEIVIPMLFEYKLDEGHQEISKTVSLDIRPSLYNDPINYTFKVTAKMNNTTQDKLITTSRKYIDSVKYNTTVTK